MSTPTNDEQLPFEKWWREYEKLEIHHQTLDLLNRDAIAKRIARDAWAEAASRTGQAQALRDCHRAIASLPEDALGRDAQGGWFYRDELLLNIDKALAASPAETAPQRDPDHLNPAKGGNKALDDYWKE